MIDCPPEMRRHRAGQRGWTDDQLERREAVQLSVDDKRAVADVVISNDGTQDDLRQKLDVFWYQHVASRLSR
jgi:dephospho-CoA kinase